MEQNTKHVGIEYFIGRYIQETYHLRRYEGKIEISPKFGCDGQVLRFRVSFELKPEQVKEIESFEAFRRLITIEIWEGENVVVLNRMKYAWFFRFLVVPILKNQVALSYLVKNEEGLKGIRDNIVCELTPTFVKSLGEGDKLEKVH